jgi:hypothetical protein
MTPLKIVVELLTTKRRKYLEALDLVEGWVGGAMQKPV